MPRALHDYAEELLPLSLSISVPDKNLTRTNLTVLSLPKYLKAGVFTVTALSVQASSILCSKLGVAVAAVLSSTALGSHCANLTSMNWT